MYENLLSFKGSSAVLRTCTSCCPFDAKKIPHPQFNYSSADQTDIKENGITSNTDACCLSKLQVDCRIQCDKKKKMKNKRYDSIHSSSSTKRSISSSNQLSPNRKRKKFGSSTNINSHYMHNYYSDTETSSDTDESEITEESFSSNRRKSEYRYHNKSSDAQQQHHINQNIQGLKTSIDNLTQLLVHHQNPSQTTSLSNQTISIPSISFLDKFRRFFNLFKSSSKPPGDIINEECCQILQRHHLTKQNLVSIYRLSDKNETIFLNWLRTIMPEYFLSLLLNYVKHFDLISTDNE